MCSDGLISSTIATWKKNSLFIAVMVIKPLSFCKKSSTDIKLKFDVFSIEKFNNPPKLIYKGELLKGRSISSPQLDRHIPSSRWNCDRLRVLVAAS